MFADHINIVSWEQITKVAVPTFVIKRKPMFWNGTNLAVGDVFPGTVTEAKKMYRLSLIAVGESKKPEPIKEPIKEVTKYGTRKISTHNSSTKL